VQKRIRLPVVRFRFWWTVVCAVGSAGVVLVALAIPREPFFDELAMRVWVERQLQFAADYQQHPAVARLVLGLRALPHTIRQAANYYRAREEELSVRGLVELGILYAEQGRLEQAADVFERATGVSEPQPAGFTALEWEGDSLPFLPPVTSPHAPSNHQRWRTAAEVLGGVYGTERLDEQARAHAVGVLAPVLDPAWRLPQLVEMLQWDVETRRQRQESAAADRALDRRLWLLALAGWASLLAAVALLVRYRAALRRRLTDRWSRYGLGEWGLGVISTVFVRALFYAMLLPALLVGLHFWHAVSYWTAQALSLVLVGIFMPCYMLARLMPSWQIAIRAFGLATQRDAGLIVAVTAVVWLADLGTMWLVSMAAEFVPDQIGWADALPPELILTTRLSTVAALGVGAVVIAPVGEEVVFRGLVYPALRTHWGVARAALVTAAAFAVLHHYGWPDTLYLAVVGVLWAWSFERTKSLLPAMLTHGLGNCLWFAEGVLLYNPAF
jgi:membrane protease YdiL (CAAX protease family)